MAIKLISILGRTQPLDKQAGLMNGSRTFQRSTNNGGDNEMLFMAYRVNVLVATVDRLDVV